MGYTRQQESGSWSDGRMYAIAFELMPEAVERYYSGPEPQAYGDIRRVLEARGFWGEHSGVFFSNHTKITAVWLAVMELQNELDWFSKVVRVLRVLRIEENGDLMPLLKTKAGPAVPLTKYGLVWHGQ